MEIEFHQLEKKYAALRIADAPRRARLVASLCAHGQQQPVLVVRGGSSEAGIERYVLIDGYARVAALDELKRDSVAGHRARALGGPCPATGLPARTQPGALGHRGGLAAARADRRATRIAQRDLGPLLGRSPSWVSRRLGPDRRAPGSRRGGGARRAAAGAGGDEVPGAVGPGQSRRSVRSLVDTARGGSACRCASARGCMRAGAPATPRSARPSSNGRCCIWSWTRSRTSPRRPPIRAPSASSACCAIWACWPAICRRVREALRERETDLPWPTRAALRVAGGAGGVCRRARGGGGGRPCLIWTPGAPSSSSRPAGTGLRAIARALAISRNSVRAVLAAGHRRGAGDRTRAALRGPSRHAAGAVHGLQRQPRAGVGRGPEAGHRHLLPGADRVSAPPGSRRESETAGGPVSLRARRGDAARHLAARRQGRRDGAPAAVRLAGPVLLADDFRPRLPGLEPLSRPAVFERGHRALRRGGGALHH